MRLLFDQNISFRVVNKLIDYFTDCKHVSDVGLKDCEDSDILVYAQNHNYTVVTFDSDFYELCLINGYQSKIIWLRTGNLTTNEIAQVLIKNRDTIYGFTHNPEQVDTFCLEME